MALRALCGGLALAAVAAAPARGGERWSSFAADLLTSERPRCEITGSVERADQEWVVQCTVLDRLPDPRAAAGWLARRLRRDPSAPGRP